MFPLSIYIYTYIHRYVCNCVYICIVAVFAALMPVPYSALAVSMRAGLLSPTDSPGVAIAHGDNYCDAALADHRVSLPEGGRSAEYISLSLSLSSLSSLSPSLPLSV